MKKYNEKLEVYDLDDNLEKIEDRTSFYDEIKKEYKETKKITHKVKTIRLLLLTSSGKVYIQRRSFEKPENPGLYDKTIGGHVKYGHTLDLTLVQECHEELGFPAVVLTNDEFKSAIKSTDLKIIGLLKKIEYIPEFISIRKNKDGDFQQPLMNSFYIGYYDGAIRFADAESTGIEVFTLKQLESRIKKYPDEFTEDLKFMIKRYKKYLIPIKDIKTKNKPILGV